MREREHEQHSWHKVIAEISCGRHFLIDRLWACLCVYAGVCVNEWAWISVNECSLHLAMSQLTKMIVQYMSVCVYVSFKHIYKNNSQYVVIYWYDCNAQWNVMQWNIIIKPKDKSIEICGYKLYLCINNHIIKLI